MGEPSKPPSRASDWTRLLTDPDLVSHLSTLLQTYREVAPEKREAALLEAMREIKEEAAKTREAKAKTRPAAPSNGKTPAPEAVLLPSPEHATVTPPFEPEQCKPCATADRRRHRRVKCYVAVEIHVKGTNEPIWGNLANVGRGGCMVETATVVPAGKELEIGLWVSSGKLWVKGVILSGIATRSAPSYGARVRFSEAELLEKEHLREFLKFVRETTQKAHHSGSTYVAQLKS